MFDGWRDGRVHRAAAARGERQWEQALLTFLKQARRDATRAARALRPARKAKR
ncbi:MAG: hypothetical protein ACYC42_10320 [Lysobacter sp.]